MTTRGRTTSAAGTRAVALSTDGSAWDVDAPLSLVAPLTTAQVSRLGTKELMGLASQAFAVRCSQDAVLAMLSAELDRREDWRESGATSLGAWLVQHLGVSDATARAYAQVSEQVDDLPHLRSDLAAGRLSLDKVRSVLGVATPQNEAGWAEAAAELSFRDLGDLVRSKQLPTRASDAAEQDKRSLRFNDSLRTIVAQLPAVSYAQVRAVLEKRAKKIDSDGETPFDQRLADALVSLCGGEGGIFGWGGCPVGGGPRAVRGLGRSAVRAGGRARAWRADRARRWFGAWPVTPRWSWPSTTSWATPCTRAGPSGCRQPHSVERSGAAIGTVSFRAVTTCSSPTATTSMSGSTAG